MCETSQDTAALQLLDTSKHSPFHANINSEYALSVLKNPEQQSAEFPTSTKLRTPAQAVDVEVFFNTTIATKPV